MAKTLAALSAIYQAIKIPKGTNVIATYLDCSKFNLLSEISLEIDATIAFCKVSALEQTKAIPKTMKNEITNEKILKEQPQNASTKPKSNRRIKNIDTKLLTFTYIDNKVRKWLKNTTRKI